MQLETLPGLVHTHCVTATEARWKDGGAFAGHQSVTEVEICEDYFSAHQVEQAEISALWQLELRR